MPVYNLTKDETGGFNKGKGDIYWFERTDGITNKKDWVLAFNRDEAKELIIRYTDKDATFAE